MGLDLPANAPAQIDYPSEGSAVPVWLAGQTGMAQGVVRSVGRQQAHIRKTARSLLDQLSDGRVGLVLGP